MPDKRSIAAYLALAILCLYAGYCVVVIATHSDSYQWDFRSYYYAARTCADGGDPYDPTLLSRAAGGGNVLRFVYPPFTLAAFAPFAALPYSVACELWLALKLIASGIVLYLWIKYVVNARSGLVFALIVLFGFGRALLVDLAAGNISTFEQCLLWAGIIGLLRRRTWIFCLAIVLASCFKLTPILFASLLIFVPDVKHRWTFLGATVISFLAIQTIDYWQEPARYAQFLAVSVNFHERGAMGNPSLLSLIRDLSAWLHADAGVPLSGVIPPLVYLTSVAVIVFVAVQCMRLIRRSDSADTAIGMILLFCLTYALVLPRFKNYSFILLLPAAYYVLNRLRPAWAQVFLLVVLVIPVTPAMPLPLPGGINLPIQWHYYPLLLAIVIWFLCLVQTRIPFVQDKPGSRSAQPTG